MIQVSIHSTKLLSFCHIVIITNYECRNIISDIDSVLNTTLAVAQETTFMVRIDLNFVIDIV